MDAPVGTVVGASGCSGSDSFAILSLALEEFDGCYLDAESIYEEGTFFSQTGEFADGALSVFAATIDNGQTFSGGQIPPVVYLAQGIWVVGTFAVDTDDIIVSCISSEDPATSHPADSTFICDLTNSGNYVPVSDAQFSVTCGCDSESSASSTTSGASGTTYSSPGARNIPATPAPAVVDATTLPSAETVSSG
ncbi:unnamed protein product, partial [Pylaiella littoralis]